MSKAAGKQPWIHSALTDGIFILSPPFLVLLVVILFPSLFHDGATVSTVPWIILVLCIDVAHVYTTLYRTYLDPEAFGLKRNLFLSIPLCVFACGVLLYSISPLLFWRIAAYLAVFHFIRQQYGFLRIYSRKETLPKWSRLTDTFVIYILTLYPIAWWHLNGPREFSWFVENDFIYFNAPWLLPPLKIIYFAAIIFWIVKETILAIRTKRINVPKLALVAGTGLSWYIGIVLFNGDLVFTALNVISHGIPYMALTWIYGNKKYRDPEKSASSRFMSRIFKLRFIFLFAGIILLAAYVEEGLWDSLVWNDHPGVFSVFQAFSPAPDLLLAFIVPLLSVPQLTHYVLDGFIWKIRKDDTGWRQKTLEG
jgi:hypothetical protein